MASFRSNSWPCCRKGTAYFSILLGLVYLAVFHLWILCSPREVHATGCLVTAALLLIFWRVLVNGYFLNKWDAIFHFCVILDIFLEAILLPVHDDFGFYWCAAGFGLVIVGYRLYLIFIAPTTLRP